MGTRQEQLDTLRTALEEQFERHTAELTKLTIASSEPEHNGYDRETVPALIASTRQALADTTQALRRVAEGRYGVCERCQGEIPVERLEIRPHARFCVPCQQIS